MALGHGCISTPPGMPGRYCALGIYKSIQSAGVAQNACVVWRLSGHAHPVRGVVPDRVQPVLGAAGAPRVLSNVRRFLPTQTKIEKQRPQARKNGFRFAMAPLLGRSGAGLGPPEPALRPRIRGCCPSCNCRSQCTKIGDAYPKFLTRYVPIVVSVSPPQSCEGQRPQGQQVDSKRTVDL